MSEIFCYDSKIKVLIYTFDISLYCFAKAITVTPNSSRPSLPWYSLDAADCVNIAQFVKWVKQRLACFSWWKNLGRLQIHSEPTISIELRAPLENLNEKQSIFFTHCNQAKSKVLLSPNNLITPNYFTLSLPNEALRISNVKLLFRQPAGGHRGYLFL